MLAPGLSVYIDDGFTRRMVTRYCTSLRFTKIAPGGHQQLQVQMTLPHDTFPHLGPNDRIVVTDQRTARIIFDGYLKNPTPVDGPGGQFFDLNALGGMWRASDESRALVYVSQDIAAFEKDPFASANAEFGTAQDEFYTGNTRVRTQFGGGAPIGTDSIAGASNYTLDNADMDLGAVYFGACYSGRADADYAEELVTPTGIVHTRTMSDTAVEVEYFVGDTNFPAGTRRFAVRLRRTGAPTNIADETTWTNWVSFAMSGARVDRYGVALTSGDYTSSRSVLASQVVEDLLGRLLTMCDPATAVVEATEFPIDQLAYPDGARAVDVLTHLLSWESDCTWEILERLPNGLHRFGWRAWPTAPRYVVSVADGWTQSGSDQNVCNRVLVTWTDAAGKNQSLAVTAADLLADGLVTAADLDGVGDGLTAGQIRDADQFSLADGKGSPANAAQIGRGVLLDTIKPPVAGKVTVRRKVFDLLTGNEVWPWEIEQGYVCRVREKGYDLRITQADYDHGDQAMDLTLGTPVLTADQRIARAA